MADHQFKLDDEWILLVLVVLVLAAVIYLSWTKPVKQQIGGGHNQSDPNAIGKLLASKKQPFIDCIADMHAAFTPNDKPYQPEELAKLTEDKLKTDNKLVFCRDFYQKIKYGCGDQRVRRPKKNKKARITPACRKKIYGEISCKKKGSKSVCSTQNISIYKNFVRASNSYRKNNSQTNRDNIQQAAKSIMPGLEGDHDNFDYKNNDDQ